MSELRVPDDSPPRSVALLLIFVFVRAFLATAHVPRQKRARSFLRAALRALEDKREHESVLPMRAVGDWAVRQRVWRDTDAVIKDWLPALLEVMPKDDA